MSINSQKQLVTQIMGLNAPVMATGESAGGYLGAIGPRQQLLLDLKKNTAAYAAETQKKQPDQSVIDKLKTDIEGSLKGAYAYDLINEEKLNFLIDLLHST